MERPAAQPLADRIVTAANGNTAPRWGRLVVVGLALALAAVGAAVTIWRPLAPPTLGAPNALATFPPEVLDRIAAYRDPQRVVALLSLAVGTLVPVVALLVPTVRRRLVALGTGERVLMRSALVVGVLVVAIDLATLPFDVWIGWVHERDFGFAAGSLGLWFRDRAVGLLLSLGAAGLAAAAFVAVARRAPRTWWAWTVLSATGAAALLVLLQPLVVQPLFLDTEPLAPGPTREAVAEVLTAAGEPDLGIEVGDASTRTTRVNAFVTGLGPSRRVVLYDTLLELPSDQVAYVVAHELAHREHRDLPRGVLLTATAAVPVTLLLRRLWGSAAVRRRLGDASGLGAPPMSLLAALGLAVLVVSTTVGAPLANTVSRRAEAAADHRALELTGEPAVQVALNRVFVERDLADPTPPWWVTALWGSHPSTSQRIQAAVDHAARRGAVVSLEDGG